MSAKKKVVILGHTVGVKFVIESLVEQSHLNYEVIAVVTHPRNDHERDQNMFNSRKQLYGEFAFDVFYVKRDFGIELHEAADVNTQGAIQQIQAYHPDLIVSIGCRNIIKKSFLDSFKVPVINFHTSPLPQYRGGAGDSWMILNGCLGTRQYGCSHFVDAGIDSGDIIAKVSYDIPEKVYPIDLFKIRMGCYKRLLIETIQNLNSENFTPEKQNVDRVTVFPRLYTPRDGKINFKDFSGPEIIRFIMAFGYPYEGAHCSFDEKKINILDADFFNDQQFHAMATGLVFGKNDMGCYKIALKDGYLLIKNIEVDGVQVEQKKIFKLGKYAY